MIELANETLLTVPQAAERLGCSCRTIRRWISTGYRGRRLEVIRCGRLVRTSIEAIERFQGTQETAPMVPPRRQARELARIRAELQRI